MKREDVINSVLRLEWEMFTNTSNAGGRASCQEDKQTFLIMRKAQAEIWSTNTLQSYLKDLRDAEKNGLNLVAIKYAHMMKLTFPEEYELIKNRLPIVPDRTRTLAEDIMKYHLNWSKDAARKYPKLISLGRPLTAENSKEGNSASIDNYLYSELLTYSEETLESCLEDTKAAGAEGGNMSMEILKNMAKSYGFESLEAIEAAVKKRNA